MARRSRRVPANRKAAGRPSSWPWLAAAIGVVLVVAVLFARQTSNVPAVSTAARRAASGGATGQTVDGIACQSSEQVLFHIHAHLAIFVNGTAQPVPYGIGIVRPWQMDQSAEGPFVAGGSCFYWLHTHTGDGIIHIESPVQRTYTLGNFFDIWGQLLGATRVGSATGTVIAYLDGHRFSGDPRSIPLAAHALIQLDVGQDVPPQPFAFPAGL